MPKLFRTKVKTPSNKPRGRPKAITEPNELSELEKAGINNNCIVVKVERGPHYLEL